MSFPRFRGEHALRRAGAVPSAEAGCAERRRQSAVRQPYVEAIALVRGYARSGDSERLKALAAEALSVLQSHLDHVTPLRDQR
jgi:hypothetical protein